MDRGRDGVRDNPRVIRASEGNWQVIMPPYGFSRPHVVSGFWTWRDALAYVEQRIRFRNLPTGTVKLSTEQTPRWGFEGAVWRPRYV